MCIIVDANKLGTFLADSPDADSEPIHRWLGHRNAKGVLVYSTGGKFGAELGLQARKKLFVYVQAGKAHLIPPHRFADDADQLQASGKLRSDDPHVLALARASGARLLYTADGDLIADFKDRDLIDSPRGKIYSNAGNSDLLTANTCAQPKQGA